MVNNKGTTTETPGKKRTAGEMDAAGGDNSDGGGDLSTLGPECYSTPIPKKRGAFEAAATDNTLDSSSSLKRSMPSGDDAVANGDSDVDDGDASEAKRLKTETSLTTTINRINVSTTSGESYSVMDQLSKRRLSDDDEEFESVEDAVEASTTTSLPKKKKLNGQAATVATADLVDSDADSVVCLDDDLPTGFSNTVQMKTIKAEPDPMPTATFKSEPKTPTTLASATASTSTQQQQSYDPPLYKTHYLECTVDGCTKTYRNVENLAKHLLYDHHRRPYPCLIRGCSETFVTLSGLNEHRNRTHRSLVGWPCGKCSLTVDDTKELFLHDKHYHCMGHFSCTKCSFHGNCRGVIEEHYRDEHESRGTKRKQAPVAQESLSIPRPPPPPAQSFGPPSDQVMWDHPPFDPFYGPSGSNNAHLDQYDYYDRPSFASKRKTKRQKKGPTATATHPPPPSDCDYRAPSPRIYNDFGGPGESQHFNNNQPPPQQHQPFSFQQQPQQPDHNPWRPGYGPQDFQPDPQYPHLNGHNMLPPMLFNEPPPPHLQFQGQGGEPNYGPPHQGHPQFDRPGGPNPGPGPFMGVPPQVHHHQPPPPQGIHYSTTYYRENAYQPRGY